jgi:putative endonuclease
MAVDRKEIGRLGESIAAQFLERKGFTILERNFLRPYGEIDIIAEKGGIVRFVEVKAVSRDTLENISRENIDYQPEELVHASKLEKVARTAELYMDNKKDNREFQIDVVAVFMNVRTRKAACRLYEQVL